MSDKYQVPALDKADAILRTIASEPGQLRLIDLSRQLGIHKSSMFSLLHTLERLGWIHREANDTYSPGETLAHIGSVYERHNRLIDRFHQEGLTTMRKLGETIQLARLDGSDVLYLAKLEAPTPVRLASAPGMRFPAHQTALGKAMLAVLRDDEVRLLYSEQKLPTATPYSIASLDQLLEQLQRVRADGLAYDEQESVFGFCCIAGAVAGRDLHSPAAVSCSIPLHAWPVKREQAKDEIRKLALLLAEAPAMKERKESDATEG